jgi:hypothetical protein
MQLKFVFPALMACVFLANCYAPGEGRDADVGRARGAQLIRSIEDHKKNNLRYPTTLAELVPTQLSRQELAQLLVAPPLFDYGSNGPQDYYLTFSYSGSLGTISCWHFSEKVEPAWACHGTL